MAWGDYINDKVAAFVKDVDTRDPFKAAKAKGIIVEYREDFIKLKGMYYVIDKQRFIFINPNIPLRKQVIVCAHELGHDSEHRDIAKRGGFQEYTLYDMKQRTEYEANTFAAHFLLDGDEIYSLAKEGYDTYQIANTLDTDVNLLLIKMDEMNRVEGYDFNLMCEANRNFLRERR